MELCPPREGTKKPLKAIAQELRADLLVEGSVSRSGDTVRINAQLIDTKNDDHLWANSFEGPLSDVMALGTRRRSRSSVTPGSAHAAPPPAQPGRPPPIIKRPMTRIYGAGISLTSGRGAKGRGVQTCH